MKVILNVIVCSVLIVQEVFAQYQTIIKTNLLNIPFNPSLHIEQQIMKRSSIQLDAHYVTFNSINQNKFFNGALSIRRYNSRNIKPLEGFYSAVGGSFHYNFLVKTNSYLGLGPKIGFQKKVLKDRLVLDSNVGFFYNVVQLDNFNNFLGTFEGRIMAGIGYLIRKK
jgi:Protein of unknown function (DUF3575)